jgi:hypothetical protein
MTLVYRWLGWISTNLRLYVLYSLLRETPYVTDPPKVLRVSIVPDVPDDECSDDSENWCKDGSGDDRRVKEEYERKCEEEGDDTPHKRSAV